jgi:hypothetical protein
MFVNICVKGGGCIFKDEVESATHAEEVLAFVIGSIFEDAVESGTLESK